MYSLQTTRTHVQCRSTCRSTCGGQPRAPRFTIEQVRQKLTTTFPTATAAVKLLEQLGIVSEMTGQKKNRSFSYAAYVDLLAR